MVGKIKVRSIGNSAGAIFPRDILAKLRVENGDDLYYTETPNGIELRSYDEEFARQMESAERVMKRHRDVLRKLAEYDSGD